MISLTYEVTVPLNPINLVRRERISWPPMNLISHTCGGLPVGIDRWPSLHRYNRQRMHYSSFCPRSPAGNKFRHPFVRRFPNSLHVCISDYNVLLNVLRDVGFEKENGRKRNKKVSKPTFQNCIAFESLFDGRFARKTKKCVLKSQSAE